MNNRANASLNFGLVGSLYFLPKIILIRIQIHLPELYTKRTFSFIIASVVVNGSCTK